MPVTYKLSNQYTWKVLFTCEVYTYCRWLRFDCHLVVSVPLRLHAGLALKLQLIMIIHLIARPMSVIRKKCHKISAEVYWRRLLLWLNSLFHSMHKQNVNWKCKNTILFKVGYRLNYLEGHSIFNIILRSFYFLLIFNRANL